MWQFMLPTDPKATCPVLVELLVLTVAYYYPTMLKDGWTDKRFMILVILSQNLYLVCFKTDLIVEVRIASLEFHYTTNPLIY